MVKSSTQESNSFIFVSVTNKSYWIGHLLILQICSQITRTVNANPQTKMHKISEPKGMDFKSETLCISNGFLSIHAGIITQSTRQFHIIFIYGWHFADTLFKCIFVTENLFVLIYVSFKFASKGSIDNTVGCCYNAVQYDLILHTSLQLSRKNINQECEPTTGELWGVFCKDFQENWPRYIGTTLKSTLV